jgi:PKD repeat protein
MKKLFTIVLVLTSLCHIERINAQCAVNITASPVSLCVGDSTLLTATASIPGTYYTFDFNDQVLPPGWTVAGGATFDTLPACAAPSLDNSPFYWSSTSSVTPEIQTTDLDVSSGGTINFDFRFAGNSSVGPCETADQYNEGILVEYSTDGGGSWSSIVYFCSVPAGGPWAFIGGYAQTLTSVPASITPGNGNGSTGIFDVWAPYVIPIPAAAQTTSTRFRWRQPNSSGSCCDNWGLDNINIAAQPNLYYFWSNGVNGFGETSQYISGLTTTTCFYVAVSDTTSGQSCIDSICINVENAPVVGLSYSNPYCVGDVVTFDGTLSDSTVTNFQWDLNFDGTYEINNTTGTYTATGSFTTAGNYNVSFQGVTANGCRSSIDTVVRVYNTPTVGLSVVDPTVCLYNDGAFQALAFMFNAAGQSSTIANYEWDFTLDGIIDQSGPTLVNTTHHFPGVGTYPVVVTVTSSVGCEKIDTVNVTIVDIPHGNIVAPQVCGNLPASFSFNNTGLPLTTYGWNFGDLTTTTDVSSASNPTYLYPNSGTYPITLIVGTADGCLDTMNTTINIAPLPAGSISGTAICQGQDATFTFTQTSPDTIAGYAWTLPGGTPSTSTDVAPVINFPAAGNPNISLIITNQFGCFDTVSLAYVVNGNPSPNYGIYPVCISRFTFDPYTNNGSTTLDWDMGDGTVYSNVDTTIFNHIYAQPGDYTTTLTITDQYGCTSTFSQPVHVDDSLFVNMPNVLVQSSTIGNNQVDMDELYPAFNLCIDYTYTIFDRWGVQVFQTKNDANNPDLYCGKCFKGKAANGATLTPGVYYYVMQGNYNILKSGSITIFE